MSKATKPKLRRVVTTSALALYGIGNIVGAGVYVLIGKIAEPAGYLATVAFVLAAVVAFCAALSYAELASRFPVSAGVAVYLHKAFSLRWLSTTAGLMLVGAGIVSSATLLKGFAGYFHQLLPLPGWLIMTALIILLTAIMLRGIKESVAAAVTLTIIEVGGLLFLVGSILFTHPEVLSHYAQGFTADIDAWQMSTFAGIFAASFLAFYAFVGFEDMVNIAEEVKEPKKAFPRAIIISLIVVTILYIIVAIATLGMLSPDILGRSTAPLAEAYRAATGGNTLIIIAISLLATLNGILVNVIMGSRFLYGMGNHGWISKWFAKVSGRHIPARSVVIVAFIALLGALWLPIESLAQITSLLLLLVFVAVNVSLIVVRKRDTPTSRSFRIAPSAIPWFGAAASLLLIVGQLGVFIFT